MLNFSMSLLLWNEHFSSLVCPNALKEDFKKAGYLAGVQILSFEQIYKREKPHIQFLDSALTTADVEYIKPCEYVLCALSFLLVF